MRELAAEVGFALFGSGAAVHRLIGRFAFLEFSGVDTRKAACDGANAGESEPKQGSEPHHRICSPWRKKRAGNGT